MNPTQVLRWIHRLCLLQILSLGAGEWGPLTYEVNDESVTITSCDPAATNVDIPASIENLPVTQVGRSAFSHCVELGAVSLPETLLALEDYAFYGCRQLKSISLPAGVENIGRFAFTMCTSLNSVTVDSRNEFYADREGLLYTSDLRRLIHVPQHKDLDDLVLPETLVSIGDSAFWECPNLTSITLPDSVREIGIGAFGQCASLASVTLGPNLETLGDGAFMSCASLGEIDMPPTVTAIGHAAFAECSSLVSVALPQEIKIIHGDTFRGCEKLTSIQLPDTLEQIGDNAFYACHELTSLSLPAGLTTLGEYVFADCFKLTSLRLPSGVTQIGDYAFYNTIQLESLSIPEVFHKRGEARRLGVETIYPWAFHHPETGQGHNHGIRLAPVIMVQGHEGALKTIEIAESPEGPWRFWMTVSATQEGVAITDMRSTANRKFYRVVD